MNVLTVATGQTISVTATVEDEDGPATPAAITFSVVPPNGVEDTDTAVSPVGVGVYVKEYTLSQRGTYGFQIDTTAPESSYWFNVTTDWGVT